MTAEHLPECPAKEPWYTDMDSYYCCSECNPGVTPPWEWACICNALRACEQRVADEIWGAIRDGSQYKSGFEGGLDAAREAVERVSSLLQPLGPAIAAIDELRNPPSLPPTKGRAHKY